MKKYKMIALIGESGSGKDTILKEIIKNDKNNILSPKISYTTRPKRDYEINGIDYHFVDQKYFLDNIQDFFEVVEFNNWYYGSKYIDLSNEKINIGIFDMKGIEEILQDNKIDLIIYYIYAKDKIRLIRALNREEEPNIEEIIRRYKVDKIDFSCAREIAHIVLKNENYNELKYNVDQILKTANIWKENK